MEEFRNLFGDADDAGTFGCVPMEWRIKNVLAEAEIKIESGGMVDVEEASVRRRLETQLADILKREKVRHIDTKELRSKNRRITQHISRVLFDDGHAVIIFRSHLDGMPCYALFESRARLDQIGQILPLSQNFQELVAVCKEFKVSLGEYGGAGI